MAANTRFGWHSGTMRCRDAKILGDIYIQDDIIFSDVSAGTLGVTGGIDMTGTTSAIGIDFTGGAFATGVMMAGTGTSARQTMAEAEDFVLGIYTTCADTDGANTAKPLYVNAQYSGAGQVARAAEFVLYPTAKLGGWANALKAYTDFSGDDDGGSTGLASAICAEMKLPNGACQGAMYPLEIEWVGQASTNFSTPGTGSASGFMILNATGTVTDFDSDGVFMSVNGLSAGSGKLLAEDSHTLRCDIGSGTSKYLLLSDAADSISFDYAASIAEVIAITVATTKVVTTGMSMSGLGSYTTGILLDATAIGTGISITAGSLTDGIKISGTTPVDGIEISSACSGHMINLSGASTGNGLTISGATSDTGVEVSGTCTNFAIDVSGAQTAAGISVAGTCGSDGLVISGACTTSAIHISGDQAIGMLVDVDGALDTGISFAVDNGVTMTTGIDMTCTGTGTVTNAISLTYTASASNGMLMDVADAMTLTAGIRMDGAGTYTDGILLDADNFVDGIHITGTPSQDGIHINVACGNAGIHFDTANLNCIKSVFNVGAQLGQYVQGIKMEHTRSADIQPSTGGWWGAQIVLNAGTGYTALDQTAYVLHCVFKGDATAAASGVCNVGRFETQSNGKVADLMVVQANDGSTIEGAVASFVSHVAPTTAIVNIQNGTAGSTPVGLLINVDQTMTNGIEINAGATVTTGFKITGASTTTTGIDLGDYCTTGISIGTATTGLAFTGGYTSAAIQLGTSSSKMTLAGNDDHVIDINVTSAVTGDTIRPVHMIHTMTGAGQVGGRAEFDLQAQAALGGYSNALKATVVYNTSGSTSGLGSCMCSDLTLSTGTTVGTYACYEANILMASGDSTGTATSFFQLNADGTGEADLDGAVNLFSLGDALTAASTKFIDTDQNTHTPVGGIRILVGGTTYYLAVVSN